VLLQLREQLVGERLPHSSGAGRQRCCQLLLQLLSLLQDDLQQFDQHTKALLG
jgi:hypothetical protein